MGITIHCGKLNMDMSYSTFDRWRIQLAKALNENFGNSYEKWMYSFRDDDVAAINAKIPTVMPTAKTSTITKPSPIPRFTLLLMELILTAQ